MQINIDIFQVPITWASWRLWFLHPSGSFCTNSTCNFYMFVWLVYLLKSLTIIVLWRYSRETIPMLPLPRACSLWHFSIHGNKFPFQFQLQSRTTGVVSERINRERRCELSSASINVYPVPQIFTELWIWQELGWVGSFQKWIKQVGPPQ